MAQDSLNAIAYSILNQVNSTLGDDSDLDIREVKREIRKQRALFLRNEYNKNARTWSDDVIQDLGCVELESADRSECCDVPAGCNIKRTVLKIPDTIELHNRTGFVRIGPVDKIGKDFNLITTQEAPFWGNGRFNKGEIAVIEMNDRLYFISHNHAKLDFLKYANVRGVFEDVEAAAKFSHCSGAPCYTDTDKYYLTDWMEAYIKNMIVEMLIKTKLQSFADRTNNNKDDDTREV